MSISISPRGLAAVRHAVFFPNLPSGWIAYNTNTDDRLLDPTKFIFYYKPGYNHIEFKSQYEYPELEAPQPGVSGYGNMTVDTRGRHHPLNEIHFGEFQSGLEVDSYVYDEEFPGDIPPDEEIEYAIRESQRIFENPVVPTGTPVVPTREIGREYGMYMHPLAEQARLRRNEESETSPSPSPSPSPYRIYFGDFDSLP